MSDVALTTIGVIFGWGVETKKGEKPTTFKEIEECVGIGSAAVSVDSIDVTCTKATRRKRKKGLEDAGDSLTTTFNYSDAFLEQWGEMYSAYETAKKSGLGIWFEAYHPDRENACFYIVEPGRPGKPEISVGGTYQTEVSNVIIDLPDDSTAIKPTEPTASGN
jgi:hypothetical protein